MYYLVIGEPRPKVYTDLGQARKARLLSTWEIESFHTLKEAGRRRKEILVGAEGVKQRKRERETTRVLSQREFEDEAGRVVADDPSFTSWLHGQYGQAGTGYYDPEEAWRSTHTKQDNRDWFNEFRAFFEETFMRGGGSGKGGDAPPSSPPPRQKKRQRKPAADSGTEGRTLQQCAVVLDVQLTGLTEAALNKARKVAALREHPDKHPKEREDEQTGRFRLVQESFEQLQAALFPH